MLGESRSFSGNILFRIFWWIVLRVNPRWATRLMYFGLRDGSFGRTRMRDPALSIKVFGHIFNTPIGIAGGVDKRGNVIDHLMQIGYGFGTFGPYTLEKELPLKQTYYLKKQKSILVQSVGYRNPGLLKMLPWFVKRRYLPHFVGVDLVIPAESEDQNIKQGRHFTYQEEFVLMSQKVAPYCDFITLDLSHPNSELSLLIVDGSTIIPLVKSVREAVRIAAPIQTPPVLVKIPLDLNDMEIALVARNLMDSGVDGVIIGGPLSMGKNKLLQLPGVKDDTMGMLTGALVKDKTVNLIHQIYQQTKGQLTIVGCGGVFTAEDALEEIYAGASLIELDTATLIFGGPNCVADIHKKLLKLLAEKKFTNVAQAVGYAVKEVPTSQSQESASSIAEQEAQVEQKEISQAHEPIVSMPQLEATPVTPQVQESVMPTTESAPMVPQTPEAVVPAVKSTQMPQTESTLVETQHSVQPQQSFGAPVIPTAEPVESPAEQTASVPFDNSGSSTQQ